MRQGLGTTPEMTLCIKLLYMHVLPYLPAYFRVSSLWVSLVLWQEGCNCFVASAHAPLTASCQGIVVLSQLHKSSN